MSSFSLEEERPHIVRREGETLGTVFAFLPFHGMCDVSEAVCIDE